MTLFHSGEYVINLSEVKYAFFSRGNNLLTIHFIGEETIPITNEAAVDLWNKLTALSTNPPIPIGNDDEWDDEFPF